MPSIYGCIRETSHKNLFATDIGTSTSMHMNIKRESGLTCVLAKESGSVCFVDGCLEVTGFVVEFSANVNVAGGCVHGTTSD
jgi:hypothetical protein